MNLIVFLWWMSGILSLGVLFFAIIAQSVLWTLISGALFLPIAYYFGGAENAFRFIGLIPLIHIVLACVFFWMKKRN
ncbi:MULTISPECIES: hypothetical protein [Brevibacillus]|jgi:hypothetical protein|uniref:Uncharacterized protein n=1 Tax=Brevibacillus thermoruber TaxID=33942 RepID=A0A9X3TM47_9BACL|nr:MULTISPECIES: hypothetical protein [Brevibacillus]MDA5107032.1 hypothetical protein [Brevibacillus thermoruber]UYZ11924.1 hypothetical protein A6764_13845 [Brevibacillus sp. WF146]